MGVASPELMAETFLARFNERDAAGLLALYEADAVFTFDGVQKAVGHEQIKGALASFLASPFKMRGSYDFVHVAGGSALDHQMVEVSGDHLGDSGTASL